MRFSKNEIENNHLFKSPVLHDGFVRPQLYLFSTTLQIKKLCEKYMLFFQHSFFQFNDKPKLKKKRVQKIKTATFLIIQENGPYANE